MAGPDFNKASGAARKLLQKYLITKPPIDPEFIAEAEGVRVTYAQFEAPDNDKFSGFFRLEDRTIVVNSEIHPNRMTFTIAHELGHYVLHQEYIRSNNYIPMPRRDYYDGPKPIEEIEADTFAANLLAPLSMLKYYSDVASTSEMSRIFFVSQDVIVNRLDLLRRFPGLAS